MTSAVCRGRKATNLSNKQIIRLLVSDELVCQRIDCICMAEINESLGQYFFSICYHHYLYKCSKMHKTLIVLINMLQKHKFCGEKKTTD